MVTFDYPTTGTGEPRRMNRAEIAALATGLRRRIAGSLLRPVPLERLLEKTATVFVNGRQLRLAWDVDGDVRDDDGKPVLGACVHDPAEPTTVMLYVNGTQLGGQPEVMRSTAVHELAHAIFDMPAALGGGHRAAFRTTTDRSKAMPGAPIDWAEWRADEFMGAFLVPPEAFAKAIAKQAGALRLRFGWRNDRWGRTLPFIDHDPREERVGWLVDHLAEAFGVSPPFIVTRLRAGGFVRRPVETEIAR